mmetsp:Transcript_34097/g.86258  ORF Transcript_34097/g.86258 Transcript_34097/m.86258 type:complete len:357 (-) Transcript_34097:527-1597(-)
MQLPGQALGAMQLQEAKRCKHCGCRMGLLWARRGFGWRERTHEARCEARQIARKRAQMAAEPHSATQARVAAAADDLLSAPARHSLSEGTAPDVVHSAALAQGRADVASAEVTQDMLVSAMSSFGSKASRNRSTSGGFSSAVAAQRHASIIAAGTPGPNPFDPEEVEVEGEDEGPTTPVMPPQPAKFGGSGDPTTEESSQSLSDSSDLGSVAGHVEKLYIDDMAVAVAVAAARAGSRGVGEAMRRQEPSLDLKAQVWRCTSKASACSFRRHDRRMLRIAGGRLHICKKGSMTAVKSAVDLARDVSSCQVWPDKMLFLHMRQVSRFGEKYKAYLFEFEEAALAEQFCAEMGRVAIKR